MRRERRPKTQDYKFFYIAGTLAILLVILLVVLYSFYNNKLKDISQSMLPTEKIIGLVPNDVVGTENQIETTGSIISKSIEEAEGQILNQTAQENAVDGNILDNTLNVAQKDEQPSQEESTKQEEVKKELVFGYPVDGEVLRDFSIEKLIFSQTLDEWTIHQGLDIKADRTTVVKASEDGIIAAIKNDPRYGLTVIIEHDDGYKTVYSNLLTTEFIAEDEKVTKGQSIGTIGNSAVFEISDDPHLHFELIKDGEYLDPKLYLK